MNCLPMIVLIGCLVALAGCLEGSGNAGSTTRPTPVVVEQPADEQAAANAPATTDAAPDAAEEKSAETKPPKKEEESDDATATDVTPLKLEGISLMQPKSWKSVKPKVRIIMAEFQIPRAKGDENDGRLTITLAGGSTEENVRRWGGEFNQPPGQNPKAEVLKINGVEATWVEIGGEWKGPSFAPTNPLSDYRLLGAILPISERDAYFFKFIGPRATIGEQEQAFKDFVKSARFAKP